MAGALPFSFSSLNRSFLFNQQDEMDFTGVSREADHLCILIHGLWGNPDHLKVMANELRKKHPEESLHILVAKRNCGSFTYDGIELGGERVCAEIEDEIEKLAREGQTIKKLSVVGYSLGGLVGRYAVGLLESKGMFEKITPVNFTTFATPHLGVRTPLKGYHNHIWNVLGARALSASGRQLFTIDKFRETGRPLLEILADPESIFIKGLAKFERRTLYTNIINDRSAVYYTTGISRIDPYSALDKVKLTYLKGYADVILDPNAPIVPIPEEPVSTFFAKFQAGIKMFPLYLAMIVLVPIGVMAFLLNSCIQSLRSNRRIRLHEKGLMGIQTDMYRVPLLINGMREVVEDVYENLNNAQSHEYLGEEPEPEMSVKEPAPLLPVKAPVVEEPVTVESVKSVSDKPDGNDTPILALAPCQFRMIEALDKVGWRKYPIYIHKGAHSHAAIITRMDKPHLDEGKEHVIRHWLDEEFIL